MNLPLLLSLLVGTSLAGYIAYIIGSALAEVEHDTDPDALENLEAISTHRHDKTGPDRS